MKRLIAGLALVLGAAAPSWAQVAQGGAASPAPQTVDSVRQAAKTDKRGVVERNMQLTPAEAAVFWPIYDDYQRDLARIVQRQNRAILDYVNTESSMTDANARRIAREVLATDFEEQKLRERYQRKLQGKLSARKAVRYMQIENKLRTIERYDLAERISLVR